MVPWPAAAAATTPEVPCAPSPRNGHSSMEPTFAPSFTQALGAALASQSVKLAVVPDSSERNTGVIARSGRATPGLSAAIAASFQLVIWLVKMPAMVAGLMLSESMPSRLKNTAIGEIHTGNSNTAPSAGEQLGCGVASSSSLNDESEPVKKVRPSSNWSRPVPEPVGL